MNNSHSDIFDKKEAAVIEGIKQDLIITALNYIEEKKSFAKTINELHKISEKIEYHQGVLWRVKLIINFLHEQIQNRMEDSFTEDVKQSILSSLLLLLTKD